MEAIIKYSNIDRLYYIYFNGEEIHYQQEPPQGWQIADAIQSDNWKQVFIAMYEGQEVRISQRIYYEMLGAVPPKQHKANSFFAGECYTGNFYMYFDKRNNFCFGAIRDLTTKALYQPVIYKQY